MAVYNTDVTVGLKEDISDIITNIAPVDTPFQTMIGTEKAHNVLIQWQEDDLAAVKYNGAVEGSDASTAVHTPTVMRQNHTQIFSETVRVSGSNEATAAYGRKSELAYQLELKSKELKRDLEHALVGTAQVQEITSGHPTLDDGARLMAGAQAQITIGGNVVDATSPDANDIGLIEAHLLDAANLVYVAGGEAKCFMYPAGRASDVAGFNQVEGVRTKFTDATGTEFANYITVYIDPLGQNIKCVPNRFMKADDALVFDPEMFKLCDLRPAFKQELAKTGDAENHQLVRETTLKMKNFKAGALIENIGAVTA